MNVMEELENVERMLDELIVRAGETNSDSHREYMESGIRTAKYHLYIAMRGVLDTTKPPVQ